MRILERARVIPCLLSLIMFAWCSTQHRFFLNTEIHRGRWLLNIWAWAGVNGKINGQLPVSCTFFQFHIVLTIPREFLACIGNRSNNGSSCTCPSMELSCNDWGPALSPFLIFLSELLKGNVTSQIPSFEIRPTTQTGETLRSRNPGPHSTKWAGKRWFTTFSCKSKSSSQGCGLRTHDTARFLKLNRFGSG